MKQKIMEQAQALSNISQLYPQTDPQLCLVLCGIAEELIEIVEEQLRREQGNA